MPQSRRNIDAGIGGLGLSLDIPDDFLAPVLPQETLDFDNPAFMCALAIFNSPVAAVVIAISIRPAYEDGSVQQWTAFLVESAGITEAGALSGFVGRGDSNHPAMFVEGSMRQGDTLLTNRIASLEDGKRFLVVQAMCPAELWPVYGVALEHCLTSVVLVKPQGPTVPVVPGGPVVPHDMPDVEIGAWPRGRGTLSPIADRRKEQLQEAVGHVRQLLERDDFEGAELLVRGIDSDIQGSVTLACCYADRLGTMINAGLLQTERKRVEAVYHRAVSWAGRCHPEPHTQEEADTYDAAYSAAKARLTALLGYKPAT
jgi:hypothetical protein